MEPFLGVGAGMIRLKPDSEYISEQAGGMALLEIGLVTTRRVDAGFGFAARIELPSDLLTSGSLS